MNNGEIYGEERGQLMKSYPTDFIHLAPVVKLVIISHLLIWLIRVKYYTVD